MSSLVSKRQKTSENHAAADTTQQTESQSKIPCPPRLHRSKAASKKAKTATEKKQSQQPVESDEAPDLLDCEMEMNPTVGEQLEQEEQERHSDQESLKVFMTEAKRAVSDILKVIVFVGRRR